MPDGESLNGSTLSADTFKSILADVAAGESAHKALHAHGSNYRAFYGLLTNSASARESYAHAKSNGLDRLADEMQEIADESGTDVGSTNKAKLQIETRKWLLAKLAPKKYGDHIDLTVNAVRSLGAIDEGNLLALALRSRPALEGEFVQDDNAT